MAEPNPGNLWEMLQRAAARQPDGAPVVSVSRNGAERPVTYGEMLESASGVAAFLASAAAPGDRVLVACPAGQEFAAAFFGCIAAAAVPVPVPPPLPGAYAERYGTVTRSAAPVLALAPREWAAAPLKWHDGPPVAVLEEAAAAKPTRRAAEPGPGDVAWLQYTSGTTGDPKGIPVTHAAALANLMMIEKTLPVKAGHLVASWLPPWHDMGMFTTLLAPVYSARTVLVTAPQDFMADPGGWLGMIGRRGVSSASLPSFAYDILARRVEPQQLPGLDLSSWQLAMCGADVADPAVLRRFAGRFAGAGFPAAALYLGYGLGEAGVAVATGTPGAGYSVIIADPRGLAAGRIVPGEDGIELACSGRPVPGMNVAVTAIDDGNAPCPAGEIGEIHIAGPNVTPGYWGDGEVKRTGLYLPTGDLGALYGGELIVLGRVSDRILLGGQHYYPALLERTAAAAHPGLSTLRTAAFPAGDGIAIAAEIADRVADPTDVTSRIRDAVRMAYDLDVAEIVLLRRGTLPFTTSRKVRRYAVAKAHASGELAAAAAAGTHVRVADAS